MNQQEKQILVLVRIIGELVFLHQKAHEAAGGRDKVMQEEEGVSAKELGALAAEMGQKTGQLIDECAGQLHHMAAEYWFEESHASPLPAARFKSRWPFLLAAIKKFQENPPEAGTSLETWWEQLEVA